jgi:hypothetical protein
MINLRNVLIGISAVFLSACTTYQVLTYDQLNERGTKVYKGVSVEKSISATLTALRHLGYDVTLKEVKAKMALIKTAPLEIQEGLSWAFLIRPDGNDVQIKARPKIIGEKGFEAKMMDPRFQDLWNEIDQQLNQ